MGGGGRGGFKRKRSNDVVGEKIDMFVAPKLTLIGKHYKTLCI